MGLTGIASEALNKADDLMHRIVDPDKARAAALSFIKTSLDMSFCERGMALNDSLAAKYAGRSQDTGTELG